MALTKGEKQGDVAKVVAPFSFPAGYQFDATVGTRTIKVTVPEGGVTEGDIIEVPIDLSSEPMITHPSAKVENVNPIITGYWRTGLCTCCEVVGSCLFWTTCCAWPIVLAQLMQRIKLNLFAMPDPTNHSNTCRNVLAFLVICGILGMVFDALYNTYDVPYAFTISAAISTYSGILYFYWEVKTRYEYRQKYEISASCCPGCIDDCCCIFWCRCCSYIQMARHTHEDRRHPYDLCSQTGLGPNAPEIV